MLRILKKYREIDSKLGRLLRLPVAARWIPPWCESPPSLRLYSKHCDPVELDNIRIGKTWSSVASDYLQ